ncbi:TBC1 domain family member 20 [Hypsizygus marmoreus]|uniref:TBC1 domain family member 20 n=1 Tax=Hypsizygus marmoreus TaxID=39966 RepID=A0A369K2T4_HYPMA|nr:TBC1 domain family member 20 [Hypsizygus marmoreus]
MDSSKESNVPIPPLMLWMEEEKYEVQLSITKTTIDWDELRRRSLQPGGFGQDRVLLWPQLLGVDAAKVKEETVEGREPHTDERQIRLDTDRSFVLYPVDAPVGNKETMQEQLHDLLVSIFRKRPKLNYFQGYHDIVSVLFLTLPPELRLVCAEKISLHRLRDSMGLTLEPVLGLLRVTKNLIRIVDPEFAENLERTSPLPFFALSNLLTLFAHDMPTLSLIQHVFDYILCRPPIIIVYLATAIILSRKPDIERLDDEDEDGGMGMAHSVLSGLPPLTDHETDGVEVKQEDEDGGWSPCRNGVIKEKNWKERREEDELLVEYEEKREEDVGVDEMLLNGTATLVDEGSRAQSPETPVVADSLQDENDMVRAAEVPDMGQSEEPRYHSPSRSESVEESATNAVVVEDRATPVDAALLPLPSSAITTPSTSPPSYSHPSTRQHSPSIPPSPSSSTAPISLTSLLMHADELYALYPPTHPALALSSIMGPQSVVHTWSEAFNALPGDDEAEGMVGVPGLVVYPWMEEEDVGVSGEEGESEEEDKEVYEKGGLWRRKGWGKEKEKESEKEKKLRPRRKLKKPRRGRTRVQRRTGTIVASAVLVLGVAMAVYGVRTRGGQNGFYGFGFGGSGGGGAGAPDIDHVRTAVAWIGGAMMGVTERLVNGIVLGDQ